MFTCKRFTATILHQSSKDLHAHVRTYIYARDCLCVGTDALGESDARTGRLLSRTVRPRRIDGNGDMACVRASVAASASPVARLAASAPLRPRVPRPTSDPPRPSQLCQRTHHRTDFAVLGFDKPQSRPVS
jgi:hypothetical protein